MAKVRNRLKELLAERERVEDRRIPHTEVARKTGIHVTTISRWANQVGRFDSETIAAICVYFDCEISDLLVLHRNPKIGQRLQPAALAAA